MNDKRANRIEFVDLAKGVCILLVVIFHLGIPLDIPKIDILRMPLYFLLSGLFFKDYGSFSNFIIQKSNKILIPFIFFYFLSCLYFNFLYKPFAPEGTAAMGFLDPFIKRDFFNVTLWFLLSLFWANILFWLIYKIFVKEWMRAVSVFLIGVSGYLLFRNSIQLPLFIDPALTALPFFYMGYLLKKTPLLYKNRFDKWSLPAAVLLYGVTLLLPDVVLELRLNQVEGNIFLFYIEALFVVIALLLICKTIVKLPVLSYLGRYSIIVLCTHIFIRAPFFFFMGISGGYDIALVKALTLGITILSMYAFIPIGIRYLPYVTAQKNLIPFSFRKKVESCPNGGK